VAQDIERTNVNADQKKRIAHEISNWKNACNCRAVQLTGDRMAALLQELVDAPEPEPVARVTGYYAGYLSIATVDGSVLPAGTALYAAPPHQSEHHLEMVNTPAPSVPDMPLSMEQFGGLVGLARDDASEKAIVYKATNIYGETCYFGVKATAQAWAKSGSVEEVRLRDLRVVATPAPQPPKLSDERILEIYEEAKANWNAQADQCNQWSDLGVDEVVTLVARAIEREILGWAQS
jgi:hypothetical protein